MTRLRMGIAGAVLGFGLVGAVANTQDRQLPLQSGQVIPRLELEAFVDGVVSQAMATEHIAGVSLAIVQDSNVALTKGYGFADVATARRVDPHTTIFRIGSITKTFTWMAVMNAVEGGRIGLNDPSTHISLQICRFRTKGSPNLFVFATS